MCVSFFSAFYTCYKWNQRNREKCQFSVWIILLPTALGKSTIVFNCIYTYQSTVISYSSCWCCSSWRWWLVAGYKDCSILNIIVYLCVCVVFYWCHHPYKMNTSVYRSFNDKYTKNLQTTPEANHYKKTWFSSSCAHMLIIN